MVNIKPVNDHALGIFYKENWIIDPTGYTPIQHEREEVLRPLADHIWSKDLADSRNLQLDEPFATLYHLLAWRTTLLTDGSFIEGNPNWLLSCDPVFHPAQELPLSEIQQREYAPIYAWLNELGATAYLLPPLHPESEADWVLLEADPAYRLPEETTDVILARWNALSLAEKAAAHHLYEIFEESVPSMCAILMFLSGRLPAARLAQVLLAASGIIAECADLTPADMAKNKAAIISAASIAKRCVADIQ